MLVLIATGNIIFTELCLLSAPRFVRWNIRQRRVFLIQRLPVVSYMFCVGSTDRSQLNRPILLSTPRRLVPVRLFSRTILTGLLSDILGTCLSTDSHFFAMWIIIASLSSWCTVHPLSPRSVFYLYYHEGNRFPSNSISVAVRLFNQIVTLHVTSFSLTMTFSVDFIICFLSPLDLLTNIADFSTIE